MSAIQPWIQLLTLADERLLVENRWRDVQTELTNLETTCPDIHGVQLSEAIVITGRSLETLKRRIHLRHLQGIDTDYTTSIGLQHFFAIFLGTPRSTETGNSMLQRALSATVHDLQFQYQVQRGLEASATRVLKYVRTEYERASEVIACNNHTAAAEIGTRSLERLRQMDVMDVVGQNPAYEAHNPHEAETARLDLMIRNRYTIRIYGVLERQIWSFLAVLPLVGIKVARQRLLAELVAGRPWDMDLRLSAEGSDVVSDGLERVESKDPKQRRISAFFEEKTAEARLVTRVRSGVDSNRTVRTTPALKQTLITRFMPA